MRICKICCLPAARRAKIDAALVDGVTYKRIAARFSTKMQPINTVNVCLHRKHLLPKDLVRARPAPPPDVALTLLQRVETLVAESRSIAEAAKTGQQWIAATSALREVRCCIELLGKLTGEISPANFNFNTFNFATVREEQLAAFLDAATKDARVLGLLMARLGPPTPEVHVNFVGVAELCPRCGYHVAGYTPPPMLEGPSTNGNGYT